MAPPTLSPPPAPPPEELPPTPSEARVEPQVVFVDDADARFEVSRRVQLVQMGWMLNGEATCGNHTGADLVLPENRIDPDQVFSVTDYFTLKVRGRKGQLTVTAPDEMVVDGELAEPRAYDQLDKLNFEIIRRDEDGEEDFTVPFIITRDATLPDPRASLILLDHEDPLAAALMTRGLPARSPRTLSFTGFDFTLLDTGEGDVVLSDYLASYRKADGFESFFIQQDGERFRTAPEDGGEVVLHLGDRLVIGHSVFILKQV
ncbi:MAG: hypothetical protein JXX28_13820 [Deltaproteobacteria bacterium]|nr:hypothetical protein [Deltaproteobacteria bacterium]